MCNAVNTRDASYLEDGDDEDEERGRVASVVVRIVLAISVVRQELLADHSNHPAR